MPALDIFGSSAFTMVSLTDAINKMPFVPGWIGQLGLFREQGVHLGHDRWWGAGSPQPRTNERDGSLNPTLTTAAAPWPQAAKR